MAYRNTRAVMLVALRMRVVIVGELTPGGEAGGTEQAVMGLAYGLSHLDGEDEYMFTVYPWARDWLRTHLGPAGRIVVRGGTYQSIKRIVSRSLQQHIPPAVKATLRAVYAQSQAMPGQPSRRNPFQMERSDGFYESLSPQVLHFPFQRMVASTIPSVFAPHDLLHLHYPSLLPPEEVRRRNFYYQAWCHSAAAVETSSHWARRDIISRLGLAPGSVHAIMRGAPLDLYETEHVTPAAVRQSLQLPPMFCLYPAQTWPHKNHKRLLEAIAHVRDRHNERIHLVCTGRQNEFWPEIAARIRELGLDQLVTFLGFVPASYLRALYQLARFLIYPTLFEGGGIPVLEAFSQGVPLACSAIASLSEQTSDAALLFDPLSVEGIAAALRRMHHDDDLREQMRERGRVQAQHFKWDTAARHYRALYRLVARQPLVEEDRALLAIGQSFWLEGKGGGG